MSTYIKYHTASGHIFMKFSIAEQSHLAGFQENGFECIPIAEADLDISKKYVTTGATIANREKLNHDNQLISSVIGEKIDVTGLPSGSWVICNGEMFKSASGKVSFNSTEARAKYIEVAGKYYGNVFKLAWTENLTELKTETKAKIDADAEAARTRVVTPGSGQAMTYLRKADAARSFLAGDTISDGQMSRLTDEASRLGVTVEVAAQTLVATADFWEGIDAAIDDLRLTKKDEIESATTGAMIEAIYNNITWPV